MKDVHLDEWLIDHVRGDLDPAERARVDAHLAACDDCRASRERFAALMTELARTAPAPPPIHWGAYRAELRERLERRTSGGGSALDVARAARARAGGGGPRGGAGV